MTGETAGGDFAMMPARAHGPEGDDGVLEASFVRFLEQSYPRLQRFLVRQSFDPQLAEDALHEALIVAMSKWDVVSRYEQPIVWVRKTAWHKLLTLQRAMPPSERAGPETLPANVAEPGDEAEAEELLRVVLRQLPYRQRAVLALAVEGDDDESIGRQLGLAVSTVRAYKIAARKKYLEVLGQGGAPA